MGRARACERHLPPAPEAIFFFLFFSAPGRQPSVPPRAIVGLIGVAMALTSGGLLAGWFALNWRFVDPFMATLFFIGAPFFVAMGFSNPRAAAPLPN